MKQLLTMFSLLLLFFTSRAQRCDTTLFPNGKEYYDTYHDVAGDLTQWKHYNTHDPTVNKQGEWYYMYSTDASWAGLNKNGAMKRRSKDLVNWEYLGNAFNGVPPSAVTFFKENGNPNYTDQGIWAPFLFKYEGKYRLYYSAPGGLDGVNFAYIGYAISDSASGPWVDKGMITYSYKSNINAIDPSVTYDSITQKMWMVYGSWFSGIYVLELDPSTGGIKTAGDKGTLICNRASSAYGQEGPELSYRNGWYYLFVSYDGLGDLYNVRVGRSRTPEGPYYDFKGKNMAGKTNNVPMIQSPYRFNNHPGWQGTGHCSVYNDNGKYYMFNQGRPSITPAMMVLHVREMFWIDDWPVLSPERYAGVPNCATITQDSLVGKWEHMPLIYYQSVDVEYHSTSSSLSLLADGTFNNSSSNTWTYKGDTLTLNWASGTEIDKLVVFWGWDWENNCRTILYTGIDAKGKCLWGKKVNQEAVDKSNLLVDGATYTINNGLSHLLMSVTNSSDVAGTAVTQNTDKGLKSQLWKIKSAGNGYYYLLPQHSKKNLGLEVSNGSAVNGTAFIVNTLNGTNRQKFSLISNDNGYFRVATKVSNDASCADDEGLSVATGARVIQWAYLEGLNQQWRFSRVDSIPVDNVSIDTFSTTTGIVAKQISSVQIYPNPCTNNNLTVDVSNLKSEGNIAISIIDLNGSVVYKKIATYPSVYQLNVKLPKGVYVINVMTDTQQYIDKLSVQ